MSARNIDEAVAELFLEAVSPAQMEIALQAIEELEIRHHETARQWEADLQRAEYEVELARRRYEAADPDNRLMASELETTWERALQSLETRRREQNVFLQQQAAPFSARDRQLVKKLSTDLASVWQAETTTMPERKTLLRFLVKRVHLDGVSEDGKIRIEVEWQTGSYSSIVIDRLPVGVWAPKTPSEVEQRIQELLPTQDYSTVAKTLNHEGYKSAKGLAFNQYTVGYIVRTRGWNRSNTASPRGSGCT